MVVQMLKFKMALIGLLFALSGCPDVDQYKEEQLVDVGTTLTLARPFSLAPMLYRSLTAAF